MIRIWFSFQAVADANRQKAVLEIKIQENIIEVEGKKNVSQINNEILEVFVLLLFYSHKTLIFSTKFLFNLFQSSRQQRRTRLTLRNTNFSNKPRPTRLCIQTSKKNSPTRALHIANQALLFSDQALNMSKRAF